ncbi:MAG TPA: hypothetical protein VEW71_02160 [Allosphingosinicella sp.]|nr:hypothetical protein [Allosphingosinicella sp.]
MATLLAAAAALLALGGCERLGIGGGGNASANDSASAGNASGGGKDPAGEAQANAAAAGGDVVGDGRKDLAAGAIPASSGGATLDRAFVAGRWTDTDDCGSAVEFSPDGRFIANDGNEALWNLVGDRLIVTGSRTLTMQVARIDQNTMAVVNPDGTLGGRSTRC